MKLINLPYFLISILFYLVHISLSQDVYFIDPKVVSVPNFEGWGSSIPWWADILGGLNEDVIEHVTNAFFSPEKLNLNIVRYTIGGTTPGISTCGRYRPGAATESFQDGPGLEYNWNRDPRQRRILDDAIKLGVDTFEAFSNSPPDWMTISKCSNGNFGGGLLHNNLDASNATLFADYATEVIKHFHDVWNITFTTYAPFNEPFGLYGIGGWMGQQGGTTQEGCNMARSVMVNVIQAVHDSLAQKNMDYVKISTADETQINTAYDTQVYFNRAGISQLIEKVNVHGYWDHSDISNRRDLLRKRAIQDGHRLWMDEMGWANSPINDMKQGLEIATRILRDFKKLLPSAWIYWQVMEDIGEWGLLGVPYVNATLETIQYYSGYYSMMQFSKYIKKGHSIVNVNNDNAIASYDPSSQTLVLVIVNSFSTESNGYYDLGLFNSIHESVSVTRTSASEQNVAIPFSMLSTYSFTYPAPPKSITTFVFQGATIWANESLILNGDFENTAVENNPWKLELDNSSSGSGGINNALSWNGVYNGYIQHSFYPVRLSQTIIAPMTANYFLSAWCYTNGANIRLSTKINGVQGPALLIAQDFGYKSYGFRISANAMDNITIYFESLLSPTSSSGFIDDVVLHYGRPGLNEDGNDNSGVSAELISNNVVISVLCALAIWRIWAF